MNGSDLNKTKTDLIERLKNHIGDNLLAIVITGSLPNNTYKTGWSDLDALIVLENINFDEKQKIADTINNLQNDSGVHCGINIISREEFFSPLSPEIFLEGKTLQALLDLKKYPDRLIYSKETINLEEVYCPGKEVIKKYSLSNIRMFLLRNRRTLSSVHYDTVDLKDLLKKEIRASLIMTKLAVQHFTLEPQENYQKVLIQARSIFPDFDFSVVQDNFRIIDRWDKIKDKAELVDIFRKVDNYMEQFSHYVFKKSKEL